MKIAEFLSAKPDRLWDYAAQLGVRYAICKCAPELTGLKAPDDFESLRLIHERFADSGFELIGLEGDEFDMQRIKLGLPGREADAERYRRMLENMGTLGIPLLCYNFMAGRRMHAKGRTRRSSVSPPIKCISICALLSITVAELCKRYSHD